MTRQRKRPECNYRGGAPGRVCPRLRTTRGDAMAAHVTDGMSLNAVARLFGTSATRVKCACDRRGVRSAHKSNFPASTAAKLRETP